MAFELAPVDVTCRILYRKVPDLPLAHLPDMVESASYLLAAAVRRNPIGCPHYDPELRSRQLNLFAWETARACPVLAVSYSDRLELLLGAPVDGREAAITALLALPRMVAGASALGLHRFGDRYDEPSVDAYRRLLAAIGRQEVKPRRPAVRPARNIDLREQKELDALGIIDRVITTRGGLVLDSATGAATAKSSAMGQQRHLESL